MPKTPTLVGSAEACARLGIDRSTLNRWVNSKRPPIRPAMRLAGPRGALLFKPADVDRLAAELAETAARATATA